MGPPAGGRSSGSGDTAVPAHRGRGVASLSASPASASGDWFDSHCHLHLCADAEPVAEVVAAAKAAGVVGMLAVGIDVASSRAALALARGFDLWSTAGVHPNSALEWDDGASGAVVEMLSDERVLAVGETGLDFYRDDCPEVVQRRAFADHVELAKAHDRALVIHTRESLGAAIAMLEELDPPERIVFHCWSGGHPELQQALDLGAYISFAGNVSFKNAGDLRATAARVPDDRLLVETDSPYLAPVPHRGKPNRPANVVHVGAALAEARGVAHVEIAALTAANARRWLALDAGGR